MLLLGNDRGFKKAYRGAGSIIIPLLSVFVTFYTTTVFYV